jgi:hypothetical protein
MQCNATQHHPAFQAIHVHRIHRVGPQQPVTQLTYLLRRRQHYYSMHEQETTKAKNKKLLSKHSICNLHTLVKFRDLLGVIPNKKCVSGTSFAIPKHSGSVKG